jgi:hypothetical protein
MVMRSFATVEMSLPIEGDRKSVMENLMAEFGDILAIEFDLEENTVKIQGDLHDYKMRDKIIWIVSGGKRGAHVPTN